MDVFRTARGIRDIHSVLRDMCWDRQGLRERGGTAHCLPVCRRCGRDDCWSTEAKRAPDGSCHATEEAWRRGVGRRASAVEVHVAMLFMLLQELLVQVELSIVVYILHHLRILRDKVRQGLDALGLSRSMMRSLLTLERPVDTIL